MDEKKFHALVDTSFNLLAASQESQDQLKQLTAELSRQSGELRWAAERVHNEAAHSSKKSVKDITEQILGDFRTARGDAKAASDEFKTARKSSFLMFTGIVLLPWMILFFIVFWFYMNNKIPALDSVIVLWKDNDTIMIKPAFSEKNLKSFDCNGVRCIQLENDKVIPHGGNYYYITSDKE